MIKAVCFDFDGTLVDSNRVKKDAFFLLASRFPGGAAFVENLLYQNPPLDRFDVLNRLAERYRLSNNQHKHLVTEFTATVHQKVVEADLMPGVMGCLEKLAQKKLFLAINSATPEKELKAIIKDRNLLGWFHTIKGRPSSKSENLNAILSNQGLHPTEVLIIGDGADDQDYAEVAGCQFQPVFDFRGTQAVSCQKLDDLTELNLLSFT